MKTVLKDSLMIRKYTIKGLVQGIGYRPWVAKLADELNIEGYVRNTGGIVTVVAVGDEEQLAELKQRLSNNVPTGGFVTSIDDEEISGNEVKLPSDHQFKIIESDSDVKANLPLIPADICTCDKCKEELLNPGNRRYLHPFISCTICGPRYSIIKSLPYDRDTITMVDFDMCPKCAKEYTGKLDRRRHAQTIACKECGPRLSFKQVSGEAEVMDLSQLSEQAKKLYTDLKLDNPEFARAIDVIAAGGILAVKDIGGYHLACNPFYEQAVAALRTLKHREAKAFAVMFADVKSVSSYCQVNLKEQALLESPARPIVLLKRIYDNNKPLAENVCLTSPQVGAMLPCNPVQILLAEILGPIIMTSGNASGDVLETDDDKMLQWLMDRASSGEMEDTPIAMLSHNRRILRPMDDSVMKVVCGRQQFIRRARGYVPSPISVDIPGEFFAAGGDLKSSFCYIKNGLAYTSQYLGDMESVSCQHFYRNEKAAMEQIFGFNPNAVAVDKHPGYFSRKAGEEAAENANLKLTQIQHHKAHVAAVIAEHKLTGKVLGFAFDGTGYGDDGSIWGSETFLWDGISEMTRIAHLKPMKLIGGDEGAKNCDTILTGMLHNYGIQLPDANNDSMEQQLIKAAIDNNINTVTSTSMGRLFDAVSALLDICHYNSYEGQAPIELENIAVQAQEGYPLHIGVDGDIKVLFEDIVYAISNNVDKAQIARGFIDAVAGYIVAIAGNHKQELDDKNQVVLSGGTFLNRILLERVIIELESQGFNVYIAQQLPPGDGGICLGQAYLASRQQ
ncbi:MAG: carbamoyltransferase HypF [Pseudobutyrivibrio sp.]|uniref:carbamoyltransferase HypF n=1 Tax=Pseudobutyrivibrio sp. TaxID=2014367 RepID=UPI0025FE353B|nr:carbamoyltransferase HypF [Pseudobutyrivibrio sp.]MBQ8490638.1 carbamoyltransferase HypF [Pseudobutyrivibrio sp.]